MHRTVRLKFWLFEHYWWLLLLAVASTIGTLLYLKEQVATVATVVGRVFPPETKVGGDASLPGNIQGVQR